MDLDPDIARHYEQGLEGDRLETWGRLEAARTRQLLARFLPPPPAEVLDVGGAEGVYALPLARAGYAVDLIDPVARHVAEAETASRAQPEHPLRSARVGDARSLDAADQSVDAVLMLAEADPHRWAATLRAIERVEAEPSLLGASPHLMGVGFRR